MRILATALATCLTVSTAFASAYSGFRHALPEIKAQMNAICYVAENGESACLTLGNDPVKSIIDAGYPNFIVIHDWDEFQKARSGWNPTKDCYSLLDSKIPSVKMAKFFRCEAYKREVYLPKPVIIPGF